MAFHLVQEWKDIISKFARREVFPCKKFGLEFMAKKGY
jgi:hypothetical protein